MVVDGGGAGWPRDLRACALVTLACYLSPPIKAAQTSQQLKYVSTTSHGQAGPLREQKTNEKVRVSGSARTGYLANSNRNLERKGGCRDWVWGLMGTQPEMDSTASSGEHQLVFTLEPRLDKQVCIFRLCMHTC